MPASVQQHQPCRGNARPGVGSAGARMHLSLVGGPLVVRTGARRMVGPAEEAGARTGAVEGARFWGRGSSSPTFRLGIKHRSPPGKSLASGP
jgi:hypothetical protein